jgi:hypothetical protein
MIFQCRCVWRDEQCLNAATQEDGLCNWCAPAYARTEEQLRTDPKALIMPDGEYMGIGGAGQLHDGTYDRPGACWYPDSGRTIKSLLQPRPFRLPLPAAPKEKP